MSIYKDLKRAVISGIDVLADKTATQAQKSRLVTVMKNEEKIANQAYVALGKYLYSSMREGMPEDVQQLCKVIDASKERMSRAQEIYREVIRQEEVNSEIGRTEVKENLRKVREPIVAGAVNTAAKASVIVKDTAKDTAAKAESFKTAAAGRAEDIKLKMHRDNTAAESEAVTAAPEPKLEVLSEDNTVSVDKENIEQTVMEEAAPIGQVISDEPEAAALEAAAAPLTQAAPAAPVTEVYESYPEAAPTPSAEILSDDEFGSEELVKPAPKKRHVYKARKLKDIITKKEEE